MTIKNKLYLALSFLTVVILLLGSVGSYYLVRLARVSEAIIKDNYRTLDYMQFVQQGFDAIQYNIVKPGPLSLEELNDAKALIHRNIGLQLQNITVAGEKQISQELQDKFEKFTKKLDLFLQHPDMDYYHSQLSPAIMNMEEQSRIIYKLNEQTMLDRNETAKDTADQVVVYMSALGIGASIIAFLFLFGFPSYIANPIRSFNNAIKEIAKGNYRLKLQVKSNDEFGQLAGSFNFMAAKLEEYENSSLARLLLEKRRLDEIIDQMHEGILGLNEKKEIIFANKRILKLIGWSREALLGKYAPDIAVHNSLVQDLIADLLIDPRILEEDQFKLVKIFEDEKEKMFSKHVVDILNNPSNKERAMIGHVVILSDVTEFAEKDLAKTQLMATLSHELKTPSAAIELSLNLLKNNKVGALNEEQLALVKTIEENNGRIRNMIREVLDVARIESGVIDLKRVPVNPTALIDQASDQVESFLKDKNISIVKEVASNLPDIKVDPHKTVWALNNFLVNAIRFSPANETILIKAERQQTEVIISVVDKGQGISKENQEKIFKKFNRINGITEGTGLGLAISKEFVEAMGGSIGVHSQEGKGASFWVKFPF